MSQPFGDTKLKWNIKIKYVKTQRKRNFEENPLYHRPKKIKKKKKKKCWVNNGCLLVSWFTLRSVFSQSSLAAS